MNAITVAVSFHELTDQRKLRHGPAPEQAKRKTAARSQAHETLGTMTTIIMRTSDDNRPRSFSALFQGFHFLGNLPITLVFHEAPTVTQE